MELSSNEVVQVYQKEIEEAVLGLVFKKRPELRPSGMEGSEENAPQVHFAVSDGTTKNLGIVGLVILKSKCEEIVKF